MATQTSQSMISETRICNMALTLLGKKAISSLNDPGTAAELCRENYYALRDEVLERRFWSFARARKKSQSATAADGWGAEVKHRLPAEWLQVFHVFDRADADIFRDTQIEWVREGDYILCQEQTVYMRGIIRVTDTGKFSNPFVQCLVQRLASEFAVPLKGSTRAEVIHYQKFEALLAEAATRDGQQGRNFRVKNSTLIDARRRGGSLNG